MSCDANSNRQSATNRAGAQIRALPPALTTPGFDTKAWSRDAGKLRVMVDTRTG